VNILVAERMPGVISAMAEAATGSGDEAGIQRLFKMMEEGQVSSSKVLGKFAAILDERARRAGAYQKAVQASAAQQARFNTAFDDLIRVFGQSGFEEGQANIFNMLASYLKELNPLVEGLGNGWKYVGSVIRVPMGLLTDLSFGLDKLSDRTGMANSELMALGGVLGTGLLAKKFPIVKSMLKLTGALALIEDFTAFMADRPSLIGMLLGGDSDEVRSNAIEFFTEIGNLVEGLGDKLTTLAEAFNLEIDFAWGKLVSNTLTKMTNDVKALQELLGIRQEGDEDKSWWEVNKYKFLPDILNPEVQNSLKQQMDQGTLGKPLNDFFGNMYEGSFVEKDVARSRQTLFDIIGMTPFASTDADAWGDYMPQSAIANLGPSGNSGFSPQMPTFTGDIYVQANDANELIQSLEAEVNSMKGGIDTVLEKGSNSAQ